MSFSEEPLVLPDSPVDLMRVRQLFALPSRIAGSAFLRREVADRMHERLSMIRVEPKRVLDAGCGEGADLPLLRDRFPGAKMVALDASHAMLLEAKKHGKVMGTVCANFAELPFMNGSFDMLWSSLSLHWHPEPLSVFSAWKRVLSKDGMLMFSCFGPETLSPLKVAFQQVDGYGHVLPFTEMHDLGDRMVEAG
ncbi:MAG: methyltransferase domain-containing protein, partial [Oxalobacter sp.]|nr:methyltransferase domain-containing protein [Oxalobacter sp.]